MSSGAKSDAVAGSKPSSNIAALPVAALLAWILPGLGHVYFGHRTRGIILLAVLGVTFWGGVAIGGVKSTIQPTQRTAWFMAQICTGSHALIALSAGRRLPDPATPGGSSEYVARWPAEDIAIVYTGVAGLLNLLVILDLLQRVEPAAVAAAGQRGPPPKGKT